MAEHTAHPTIEAMAKAFWNAWADEFNPWDALDAEEKAKLCTASVAALRPMAVAEPTDTMIAAYSTNPCHAATGVAAYRAMLRALLEEVEAAHG